MNLEKMLAAQAELDKHIVEKKGLQGVDLVPNTFLALQVELGEMANEGRWFKHWSDNQKPRTKIEQLCPACGGTGDESFHANQGFLNGGQEHPYPFEPCIECDATGKLDESNPLLEEFSDGVHFFLSIANQKSWQDALYIYEEQLDADEFDGDLTAWFLEMTYFINKSHFENPSEENSQKWKEKFGFPEKQYWFRMAWILFLNIGINGFEFTPEQIEEAYFAKNTVNHKRQESGY